MSESRTCRCAVCILERSLRDELDTQVAQLQFRKLSISVPELCHYATPLALLSQMHSMKHNNGSGERSDRILGALQRAGQMGDDGMAQSILLVAFVPLLHATVSSVASRFPSIPRGDIAQQAFTSAVVLLQTKEWLERKSHLAFALARELRRAVFVWARREARFTSCPTDRASLEGSISSAELFERDVTLRHFLHRSLEARALDDRDLDILIQFKLEGDFGNGTKATASNAMRQRLKRLVFKMRRRASFRIPKAPRSQKNCDTFSELGPE